MCTAAATRRIKPYDQLEFTDDFMFCKIMENNPDICKDVIELIVGIEVDRIESINSQMVLGTTNESHSIQLDVRVRDIHGRICNVEMQTQNKGDVPQRSRYYQGTIDVTYLRPGMHYSDLPDTFVVFICLFDPIGYGMAKYTFREYCEENKDILLESGTTKVIVNARSTAEELPEGLRPFLQYLMEHTAEDDLTKRIASSIDEAKRHRKWEIEYMVLEEKLNDERKKGIEIGRKEGIAIGREEGEKRLASLAEAMSADGRMNEFTASLSNRDALDKLYYEYGIDPAESDREVPQA